MKARPVVLLLAILIFLLTLSAPRPVSAQPEFVDYDNAHNLKITWVWVYQGIARQKFEVKIQNLENVQRSKIPLKLIFEDLSAPLRSTIYSSGDPSPGIRLRKAVPTEITIYDKEFVKASYSFDNVVGYTEVFENYQRFVGNPAGPNFGVLYLENSENVGAGYENLVQKSSESYLIEYLVEHINPRLESKVLTQMIPMPVLFTSKTTVGVIDENYYIGDFAFPAFESAPILDDQGNAESENGTLTFTIEWEVSTIQNIGGGWGSSGYFTIIDPEYPTGLEIETWTIERPEEEPTPPFIPPLPPSEPLPSSPEPIITQTIEEIDILIENAIKEGIENRVIDNLLLMRERYENIRDSYLSAYAYMSSQAQYNEALNVWANELYAYYQDNGRNLESQVESLKLEINSLKNEKDEGLSVKDMIIGGLIVGIPIGSIVAFKKKNIIANKLRMLFFMDFKKKQEDFWGNIN